VIVEKQNLASAQNAQEPLVRFYSAWLSGLQVWRKRTKYYHKFIISRRIKYSFTISCLFLPSFLYSRCILTLATVQSCRLVQRNYLTYSEPSSTLEDVFLECGNVAPLENSY
jgi:hypothetical protein